jgi:methionyl-tRNA formyltransferase
VLRRLRPDAILVYGTSVVAASVLSLARDLAFNMHTGISPFYRGAHCAFWPVVNRELHMLGATVHECTPTLDAGRIFGTSRADIQADDGLHEVFARCVAAGAELYVRVVDQYLNHGLNGRPQDLSLGREYLGAMRTFGPEWKARRLIRSGLVRRHVGVPRPG